MITERMQELAGINEAKNPDEKHLKKLEKDLKKLGFKKNNRADMFGEKEDIIYIASFYRPLKNGKRKDIEWVSVYADLDAPEKYAITYNNEITGDNENGTWIGYFSLNDWKEIFPDHDEDEEYEDSDFA